MKLQQPLHMDAQWRSRVRCTKGCRYTQSPGMERLYVHLMEYPFAFLELRGLAGKVDYAQFLHDGSEILFTEGGSQHFSLGRLEGEDLLVLNIPHIKPPVIVPVIELFLK